MNGLLRTISKKTLIVAYCDEVITPSKAVEGRKDIDPVDYGSDERDVEMKKIGSWVLVNFTRKSLLKTFSLMC